VAAETLLREVDQKRRKTIEQLEAEYKAKRDEVTKRAAEQRAYILESGKAQAAVLAQREATRISGAAKLQAKKLMFDATEKMLETNIGLLRSSLADYSDSKGYSAVLSGMFKYAKKRLGDDVKVECRADDAAALKKLGAKIASSDLNTIGGFKAENRDGSLELDLTFEEILRNREEDARSYILGKE
jgi:V/A-type H+/Na+-transporting ATPase subunit E